jgi:hypothetical protein
MRWLFRVGEVATAVKKASQSCQSAWAGSDDLVTVETRALTTSSGIDAEVELAEPRKSFMGVEKGLGAFVPGTSRMVVILEAVRIRIVLHWSLENLLARFAFINAGVFF